MANPRPYQMIGDINSDPNDYDQSKDLHALAFDGVDDYLQTADSFPDVTKDQTISFGFNMLAAGNSPYMWGANAGDNGVEALWSGATRNRRSFTVTTAGSTSANASVATTLNQNFIRSIVWGRSAGIATDTQNQTDSFTTTPARIANLSAPVKHDLGRGFGSNAQCFNGNLYGFVLVSETIDANRQGKLESHLAKKSGVTLP